MQCNVCGTEMRLYAENSKSVFYKCPKCSFYVGERKDEVLDFSYEGYETFDAETDKFDDNVAQARNILQTKFQILGSTPKSFLDVGCSEGVFVEAYRQLYPEGICAGIEVSEAKAYRARQRGLNVGSYDRVNEMYEFVLLRHVIEHVNNPREFVYGLMDKYVKSAGCLCIETPNNACVSDVIKGKRIKDGIYMKDIYPPVHVCGFTPRTFKTLFSKQILFLGTHNVYDEDWCYRFDTKRDLKHFILRRVKLSNNITCMVRKYAQ